MESQFRQRPGNTAPPLQCGGWWKKEQCHATGVEISALNESTISRLAFFLRLFQIVCR